MVDAPPAVLSRTAATAQTRKLRTRAALRGAMLELLLERPLEQIQITDLTARAGIGYATFFRHYAGTPELFGEIAGDQIGELLEMTIPVMVHTGSSASSTRALCQYVHDRRALWRVLLTGGAAQTVRAEFVRQAREWSGRFEGSKTSVPRDLGTVCSAGSTIDALAWWLEREDAFSVEQIAGFIDRLIITPFVGD
jgi:AcrR family transcriptional regulator